MNWTKEKPTQPGYYWARSPKNPPLILLFSMLEGGEYHGQIEPESGPYSSEGWKEFAGPILEPEEN